MNRRSFFRSLAIASAALYVRFAPTAVKAVERVTDNVVNTQNVRGWTVRNKEWQNGEMIYASTSRWVLYDVDAEGPLVNAKASPGTDIEWESI